MRITKLISIHDLSLSCSVLPSGVHLVMKRAKRVVVPIVLNVSLATKTDIGTKEDVLKNVPLITMQIRVNTNASNVLRDALNVTRLHVYHVLMIGKSTPKDDVYHTIAIGAILVSF